MEENHYFLILQFSNLFLDCEDESSEFGKKFAAGLSEELSMCPDDCFGGKSSPKIFLIKFRPLRESFLHFQRKFFGTVAKTAFLSSSGTILGKNIFE